ncbi:MAG: Uma2 family endonuclease [Planctomycetia bacterium]|nr:Uma2 family endonuclease [Planctomycetia bacterium]
MSIISPPAATLSQPPPYPIWKFTVNEYHQLIQLGVLSEDDRVELLEGWLVPQMPRNTQHDVTIDKSQDALRSQLPAGWRLRVQSAITTSDSEPEPDFAVVPGPPERYLAHHPFPQDIGMLIEVSDTSLDRDRNRKGPLYAGANIPIYWIINLIEAQVEVYTDPTGPAAVPGYRQRQDFKPGGSVPLVIGGQVVGQVAVSDLLP